MTFRYAVELCKVGNSAIRFHVFLQNRRCRVYLFLCAFASLEFINVKLKNLYKVIRRINHLIKVLYAQSNNRAKERAEMYITIVPALNGNSIRYLSIKDNA